MNDVSLRQIDESNFLECFALELGQGQEKFVSHPVRSLAQAYVYRNQCTPFGVYAGETMVGYLMVIYDYDEVSYNIWHVMIDRRHQGNGYGRKAMEAALRYILQKPFGDSDAVLITCAPDNAPAWNLYASLGFLPTGNSDDEEIELALNLIGLSGDAPVKF